MALTTNSGMSANCSTEGTSRCDLHAGSFFGRTRCGRIVGSDMIIRVYKKTRGEGRALIFTGEAGSRQHSTIHATWSCFGKPAEEPVTGELL